MDQEKMEILLLNHIKSILKLNNIEHVKISANTVLFDEIAGFDSHSALEVLANISEELNIEISPYVFGFFRGKRQPLKLTVAEIARNIRKELNSNQIKPKKRVC